MAGGIAQGKAEKKNAQANRAAAARAFNQTVGDIEAQRAEMVRAAGAEAANIKTVSAREKGVAQTAAAESGVTGGSPDAVQAQLQRALEVALGYQSENLKIRQKQLDREIEGAAAGAQSRIQANPDPSNLALRTGIAAVNTAIPFAMPYIGRR